MVAQAMTNKINRLKLKFPAATVLDAKIGDGTSVGPFAYKPLSYSSAQLYDGNRYIGYIGRGFAQKRI